MYNMSVLFPVYARIFDTLRHASETRIYVENRSRRRGAGLYFTSVPALSLKHTGIIQCPRNRDCFKNTIETFCYINSDPVEKGKRTELYFYESELSAHKSNLKTLNKC